MSRQFEVTRDIEYRPGDSLHEAQRFDLFSPEAPVVPGVFIYLHGGGWRFGDKASSERIPAALARAGVTVVNANYTLTSGHPYPRNVEDVFSAIEYVSDRAAELGVAEGDRPVVGIGGSSAGGHLASLAVTKGIAESRLAIVPASVVSWYAPLDPPSRFLKHRYPDAPYPGGFWDRGDAPAPVPRDPFVQFIGTEDFEAVTLRQALDGDPRLHLANLAPAELPPFLHLVGTNDSAEIRYSQRTWHGALASVGADTTLLEVVDADHEDPRFSSPPLVGAVIGHLLAAARELPEGTRTQ